MDKTRIPRGQVIETLDDFKYWLNWMDRIADGKRPHVQVQMKNLITEALDLKIYDDDKVSCLVEKIDSIANSTMADALEFAVHKDEELHRKTSDFRVLTEQKFGENVAFETVVNKLDDYINCHLSPLVDFDESYNIFRKKTTEGLLQAKKLLDEGGNLIGEAWTCLCAIHLSVVDSQDYFSIKLAKANAKIRAEKSPYSKFESRITPIVLSVIEGTRSKKNARLSIGDIVRKYDNKGTPKPIKIETLNNWIEKLKENGFIFNKK